MIAFVEGAIRIIRRESVVVDVGSVGWEIYVSRPESYALSQKVFFLTWQQFREESQTLYGFESEEEYELFCSLIGVKGIGCKTALNMLGAMEAGEIVRAIASEDVKTLKKLPGIGARTAGQIVLDLRGTIMALEPKDSASAFAAPVSGPWAETRDALLSLGYKPADLGGLEKEIGTRADLGVDGMLRLCLQALAKRKGV